MMNLYRQASRRGALILLAAFNFIVICTASAQQSKQTWHFGLSVDPSAKIAHISLDLNGKLPDTVVFKMPTWTTGYYQYMNFGKSVSAFTATDEAARPSSLNKRIKIHGR